MPSFARQSRMQRIASSMCFEMRWHLARVRGRGRSFMCFDMRWHLVRVMVRVRARVRIRVRVSG